jgi:tetratricopeptide (TPR) repeat protein
LSQVLVGCSNDTNIDSRCTRAAHGLKLTLLEHAEQLGLKLQWHVSNFVEEQRAAIRQGDSNCAQKMADELQKQNPLNTKIKGYFLPTIRAAVEINRKNPAKAIEILQVAAPYELGNPDPQPVVGAMLYPVYVRGQAYLLLHQGSAAAAEFQKFLDYRGVVVNCPLGALARLGLARAYAMQGDAAKAKAAYQNFLTLWKDADPDIPILKQANAEYAKLQ